MDTRIRELTEEANAQRARAEAAAARLEQASARVVDQGQAGAEPAGSLGARMEKMFRLAEQDAQGVRATATREAAAVLERARAEVDARRRQAEQALMARVAAADLQAAQRTAALEERERALSAQLAVAHQEAQALRAAAERDAEAERARAEQRAAGLVAMAEDKAQQLLASASAEVDRLAVMRAGIRSEIGRLHWVLGAELTPPDPSPTPSSLAANGPSAVAKALARRGTNGATPPRRGSSDSPVTGGLFETVPDLLPGSVGWSEL